MIISIHQPHFLPWLGYLDRMRRSDVFVLLDHVQFERQNYQNRVRIKTTQGARWLVAPVFQRARSERILDKRIDDRARGRHRWGHRAYQTLVHAYARAPFFGAWERSLQQLFDSEWEYLLDLDLASIELLRRGFDIRTPLLRSSALDVRGRRGEAILDICRALRADALLCGLGASRQYLDAVQFRAAGVELVWQEFNHPRYRQQPLPEMFQPGLSGLDLLVNCGDGSRELLAAAASGLEPRSSAVSRDDRCASA